MGSGKQLSESIVLLILRREPEMTYMSEEGYKKLLADLKELEGKLYNELQHAESRSVAAIAKQYRETIKEIEEIEGTDNGEDEISKLINDGESRSVRPNRSKV